MIEFLDRDFFLNGTLSLSESVLINDYLSCAVPLVGGGVRVEEVLFVFAVALFRLPV
jgi:hypothetical protein